MLKYLSKLRILPSWVILLLDIAILVCSSLISYVLYLGLGISFETVIAFPIRYSIFISVFIFYFLVFKTYVGIIRYSTINDIGRLFRSIFASFITLLILNFGYYSYSGKSIFLVSTLFYTTNFIFFCLIGFRVVIKLIFQNLNIKRKIKEKEKLAIIGVNPQNISLIETLTSPLSAFNLICFIDTNLSLNGKKVAGISVFSQNKKPIITYLKFKGIKSIILTKGYLKEEEELSLIEDCILYDIKVYKPELLENITTGEEKILETYNLEELLFRDTIEIKNENVINHFYGKTIMVTGGAGSIGSELAKQLGAFTPKKIVIVDNAETPLYEIELFFRKHLEKCESHFELVDVTNYEEIKNVFALYQPDIIFHAAAYKHVPMLEKNYMQAIKVNILGTQNCLELAMQFGAEKFVFVSTDKAVNPTNIMGASKRFAEMLGQTLNQNKRNNGKLQIMSTRFGNVLGSNGSVIHLFKEQIRLGGPVTVTHPEVNRFFMTIPEACKLVIEAAAMGSGGQTYLFDMGKSIRIVDLAEKMIRLSGKVPNKDIKIVFTGLRPGEKLYEEVLTLSAKTLPTYHPKIVIAQEELPCPDTLEEILSSFKSIYRLERNEVVEKLKCIVPGFVPYD